MAFMLNRKKVVKARDAYKDALEQQTLALADEEVNAHIEKGETDLASKVIEEKYPLGTQDSVDKAEINLLAVIIKQIPKYRGVNPVDVWKDRKVTEEVIGLTEKF